jgi:hypothetical protein
MIKISLTQGKFALIDDEDAIRVLIYNWFADEGDSTFYAISVINGKRVKMHRFILNLISPKIKIDHINHDGLDNQKHNLRICSQQQNNWNQKSKKLKMKGVIFHKRLKRFQAAIRVNGEAIHLGTFDSEETAAKTYDSAAKQYFCEFACLNFPEEK